MLDYLTKDETTAAYDRTRPGQAHFGGSGPAGKCCFECQHWTPQKGSSGIIPSPKRDGDGRLESRRCKKFRLLTMGRESHAVPPESLACKFFFQALRIWPVVGGRKAPKPEIADAA